MTPTRKTRREDSFDREDGQDDDGSEESAEDIIFDYSEAQSKMKEEENKRRVEEGLTVGLTKEVRYYYYSLLLRCCKNSLVIKYETTWSLALAIFRTKKSSMQRRINTKT